MRLFKVKIPTEEIREINAIETFLVTWTSFKTGNTLAYLEPQAQYFPFLEDAEAFRKALVDASTLLGDKERPINEVIKHRGGP